MSSEHDLSNQRRFGDTRTGPMEFDVYSRSAANINRLKAQLPEDLVANLVREVIRRVSSKDETFADNTYEPTQDDLIRLSEALIAPDDTKAADIISGLRADGADAEVIYLKHLARSANMLGEWWSEDRVSFTDVTVATGRMFAIMRSMRHLFEPRDFNDERCAVFASVPGEDHTMGVRMAADIFRKDGWDIDLKVGLDHDALVTEIEKNPRGIVGLSLSGEHSIEPLSRLIVALNISCPQSRLFVSGTSAAKLHDVLDLMGLDGVSDNVEDAKKQLNDAWAERVDLGHRA